jgi:hypothetical protein
MTYEGALLLALSSSAEQQAASVHPSVSTRQFQGVCHLS